MQYQVQEQESSGLTVKNERKVGEGNQVFNFSDLLHFQKIKLATGSRNHMTVYDGLNLQGKCLNQQCKAFQKSSWASLGYGKFDIGRAINKNKCRSCQKQIDGATIKTLAYKNAKIQFDGMKHINNKSQAFKQTAYEKEGLLIKFSNMDEHLCLWAYLDVTVTKIQKQ